MSAEHDNVRAEVFWFAAAAVGFNTFLISSEALTISHSYRIAGSGFISLFAIHLILSRWVSLAHLVRDTPDPKMATCLERLRYSLQAFCTSLKYIPYICAEMSGSLFYICVVTGSALVVIFK